MLPSTASKVTTDHEEIRRWAEARGAKPAAVARTEHDDDAGIIRLEFPGSSDAQDDAPEEISWDEWSEKFHRYGLAFLYQDQTASGDDSNFNKIIRRETVEEAHDAVGGKGRSAIHKHAAKPAKAASRKDGTARSEGRAATTRKSTSVGHAPSSGRASTHAAAPAKSARTARSASPRVRASRGSKSRGSRPTREPGEVLAD